jgi:hypothetical protein
MQRTIEINQAKLKQYDLLLQTLCSNGTPNGVRAE